ncbi:MAG: alpha/beta hydrolase, partial [Bacilli bacterium]|nr:alpha/beta hydrolase [Bacilli bacterium]
RYFVTCLIYFPIFFIFYISNSIKVNCSIGLEGWSEWKVYLVGAISNSIALVFILLINYSAFFINGEVFYGYFGSPREEVWLYINMVFPLVVLMFVLPILNRIFYKITNKAYLGPIVICAIFIMMSLSASVAYIPM